MYEKPETLLGENLTIHNKLPLVSKFITIPPPIVNIGVNIVRLLRRIVNDVDDVFKPI